MQISIARIKPYMVYKDTSASALIFCLEIFMSTQARKPLHIPLGVEIKNNTERAELLAESSK